MESDRLEQQIAFIVEIDKLKKILRKTLLTDASRNENDAEHSWHLAMMAMVLQEYSTVKPDLLRVIGMVLVHDLVEIDAGDVLLYDQEARALQKQKERAAAERIFGMLPPEQGQALKKLWEEFEQRETAEARFAAAIDRLQPMLHNFRTQGAAWRKYGVTADKVLNVNRIIDDGAPQLWEYAKRMVAEAVEKHYLEPGTSDNQV